MNGWSKEDLKEMCGDDIIEQLAFISGCHRHQLGNGNPSGWIIPDESLRKFAELIVRECMMLVEGFESTQEVALDEYVDYEASVVLKEHFGVK